MRISPNHPRLRLVALACWAISSWCMIYGGLIVSERPVPVLLVVGIELLALLLLAIGIAFWQISIDRRAGIVFDGKGLTLNLGHSSAFIAWENIERVGVSSYRASVLAIGSEKQLGIALRDVEPYVQSYEGRLPAARGPLARALRLIETILRPYRRMADGELRAELARCRAQSGYDVLVPEALLGGTAEAFVDLVEVYRRQPAEQRIPSGILWAR
jgi:hypothetical protein